MELEKDLNAIVYSLNKEVSKLENSFEKMSDTISKIEIKLAMVDVRTSILATVFGPVMVGLIELVKFLASKL